MKTLLLAGDREAAELLAMILETEFNAEVAQPGYPAAALAHFQRPTGRPDLVVVDGQLPGDWGVEAARAIRAQDPRVPILAYSYDNQSAAHFAELGRCLFLSRPFRVPEVVMTITLALSSRPSAPEGETAHRA